MTPAPKEERTRAGNFWALVPVALIVANLTGFAVMAYIATNDPGFSVEKDYYKKAVHWDDARAQAAENARLGWQVAFELVPAGKELHVSAQVVDSRGQRIPDASLDLDAFANARAAHVVSSHFVRQADGTLAGTVPLLQTGLWEFRFTAESRGARFTQVVRKDVVAGDAS